MRAPTKVHADTRLRRNLTTHSLIDPVGVDAVGQLCYQQHGHQRSFAAGRGRLAEHVTESDAAVDRLLLGWLELAYHADSLIPHEPHNPLSSARHVAVRAARRAASRPG
ncbi:MULTISPECIES: hypothetical protein [unclassified Nonomuraea]|uniref:hypothetical protein n=1 Tax=unclassified Nonomuraea TaxID=2593643 RepID=UPI0033E46379